MNNKKPYVVPSTRRRDIFIGLAIGLVCVAFLVWGMTNMGREVSGIVLQGTVVEKHFKPLPKEQQITMSTKGGKPMSAQTIDGHYILECKANGKLYDVYVDKETYESSKIGDTHVFTRPAGE